MKGKFRAGFIRPADATRERGFFGFLRTAAMIAVPAGALGSVSLVLYAGRKNDSRLLLLIFALWVLSPFIALAFAKWVSKHWSVISRATLDGVILGVTLVTLAVYGQIALGSLKTKTAFPFIVVPPASWLLIALAVPIIAFVAGRRRIVKGFAGLVGLVMLGMGALFGSLWVEQKTEITLPAPTGPFAVGRGIHDWTDDLTLDPLAPVPGTKRELLVWIWYPSAPGKSVAVADYVPAQLRAAARPAGGSLIFKLLTRDEAKVHSHTTGDSDVSPQQPSYPVVLLRAGASAGVLNYSTLAEDLASHGYVVVGFDAPYRTGLVVFPDGRVIARTPENNPELYAGQAQAGRLKDLLAAWTADMRFVLDRLERLNASDPSGKFTGRLDMTRVGVFGHSFGGAQAAQFCLEDSRCKAGINVDGRPLGSVVQQGIQQPFMFLLSDHGQSSDPASRQILADILAICDRQSPDRKLRIAIRGANHFTFSDDGALLKSQLLRGVLRVFGKLRIEGRRQLAVTAYCVHSFFDARLKEATVTPLGISSPLYPEIQVLE